MRSSAGLEWRKKFSYRAIERKQKEEKPVITWHGYPTFYSCHTSWLEKECRLGPTIGHSCGRVHGWHLGLSAPHHTRPESWMPLDEVYHGFIEVYCKHCLLVKRVTMWLVQWFIVRLIVGFNRAVTRTVFVHVSWLLYNLEGQRVVCREFKERFTGLDNGVACREAYKAVSLPFTLLFIIIVIIILFVTFAVTIAVCHHRSRCRHRHVWYSHRFHKGDTRRFSKKACQPIWKHKK